MSDKKPNRVSFDQGFQIVTWLKKYTQKQLVENKWTVDQLAKMAMEDLGFVIANVTLRSKMKHAGLVPIVPKSTRDMTKQREQKNEYRKQLEAKLDKLQSTLDRVLQIMQKLES